jgi:sec-independent protein translocase protein TatA
MFGKLGAPEILIVLVAFIMIFGAKRLPDMARSLGQSMRILKTETKAMRDRDDDAAVAPPSVYDSAGPTAPQRGLSATSRLQESTAMAPSQDTYAPR